MFSGASFFYRRLPSPLHATRAVVAAAYGAALAACALITENPLLLGVLLLAVLAAASAAKVGWQLAGVLRLALPIVLMTVLINVLVSRNGLTVFARLGDWGVLGQVDLTVEAVVYGCVMALRLLVVMLACLLVVCTANPDELLLAFRRISPHSALTATLATRLIPVLGQDARRLAEAQRCRPDGGARGMRGKLAIVGATVSGALDRSLDVAAVLEMRGYGARGRVPAARRALSRHDLAFAAAAVAIVGLSVFAAFSRTAAFQAYPLVSMSLSPAVFVLAALTFAVALAPFVDRRGIEP